MRRSAVLLTLVYAAFGAANIAHAQANAPVLYEGARLIIGPASAAPIEDGAFVVENGIITAIGTRAAVAAPQGAIRVDLSGKTVMPAFVDAHAHLGYEKYTTAAGDAASEHYTPENLLDHLQRSAYYGVGTVNDGGTAVVPISLDLEAAQRAGHLPPAAHYVFNAGIVPPNGGPDRTLIQGTRPLHANYEVTRADEARAAVSELAALGVGHVKVWIGDREGTYPAMPREVFQAVIDEAHLHGMEVHAHATTLADQKAIVAAGVDVLLHTVEDEALDAEFAALLREHKPYWVPLIGNSMGPGLLREVCNNEPFATQTLRPALVADILANDCRPNPDEAEIRAYFQTNFAFMIENGVRITFGSDAGVRPSKTFGTAAHHELAIYVSLGLSNAEALEAATARAAEALGLDSVSVLAQGKNADFLVLDANPLDDITNTRKISEVYLHGAKLDRPALQARWR
jgi:imidazolonepropionase-like amidohydrolase